MHNFNLGVFLTFSLALIQSCRWFLNFLACKISFGTLCIPSAHQPLRAWFPWPFLHKFHKQLTEPGGACGGRFNLSICSISKKASGPREKKSSPLASKIFSYSFCSAIVQFFELIFSANDFSRSGIRCRSDNLLWLELLLEYTCRLLFFRWSKAGVGRADS